MLVKIKRKFIEARDRRYKSKPAKSGFRLRNSFFSIKDLVEDHFERNSEPAHPCKETLQLALSMLNESPAIIVETGSSAWGANSSLLFDSYVNSFGGSFASVDIRSEPMFTLQSKCSSKSRFYCDDSVSFLQNLVSHSAKFDLVYLDSWDVDWLDPLPAAMHGFNEFMTVLPVLLEGGMLLVDDTPKNIDMLKLVQSDPDHKKFSRFYEIYGFPPGKGGLIKNYLVNNKIGKEIAHGYQLLWSF